VESFWITLDVWYCYFVCLARIGRLLADLIRRPDNDTCGVDAKGDNTRVWVYTILWVLTRVTGDDSCVGADCVRRRTLEHDFIARSRVIVPRTVSRKFFAWSTRTHKLICYCKCRILLFLRNISKLGTTTHRVKTCYIYVVRICEIPIHT